MAVPPGPVAVSVYVVVVVGLTELLPLAARLAPPLIDTLSASVVVQLKVDNPPAATVVGEAIKVSTVGNPGGAGLTVTVTLEVAVPPVPVAVRL